MIVTAAIGRVRAFRHASRNLSWGFVPTMGALHEGHLSLVRRARQENGRVAASIFVNPTQFDPTEDLDRYPRTLKRDLARLEPEGVDLVFIPDESVMYPDGFQTVVQVTEVTRHLEGASRPTHFQGVATVVTKLLNIVQPARAYFGQKDVQQTVVLRRMARDLNLPVDLVICPTAREPDGLAMSSRNTLLSTEARQAASVLYQALCRAREAFERGEKSAERLRQILREIVTSEPLARLDYVSAADLETLEELDRIGQGVLLSLAVFFGETRLIDNIPLRPADPIAPVV